MIRLYCLCTPSHERLRDDWFLPTLKDEFRICQHYLRQDGQGSYGDTSFRSAVRGKVDMIERAIERNWGRVFVVADVDIQFFGPIADLVLDAIQEKDMVTQTDGPTGHCCGFMVIRANDITRAFISRIQAMLEYDRFLTEQPAFNSALKEFELRTGFLPDIFFGPGSFLYTRGVRTTHDAFPSSWLRVENPTHPVWVPGSELMVRQNIVMHHANYTIGVENKIAQLEHVQKVVEDRCPDRLLA